MIEFIQHGQQIELRLNRPPVNALNPELLQALITALAQAQTADGRGIVLTGGAKVFSAGLDVPHLSKLSRTELAQAWSLFFAAAKAIAKSNKPIVAAIAGHNPAGGCVLALCCDYRVMAKGEFRIGLNETQVGLVVPEAIQQLLRRCVGAHRAELLLLQGAMIESAMALQIGLVDELCAADQVLTQSLAYLDKLANLPQAPMLKTRAIARADLIQGLDSFSTEHLDHFLEDWYGADTQQAINALLEKLGKK